MLRKMFVELVVGQFQAEKTEEKGIINPEPENQPCSVRIDKFKVAT